MLDNSSSLLTELLGGASLNTQKLDQRVLQLKDQLEVPEDRCLTPPRRASMSSMYSAPSTPSMTPKKFQSPFKSDKYSEANDDLTSDEVARALKDICFSSPCLSPRFSMSAFQQREAEAVSQDTALSPRFAPCTPRKTRAVFSFDDEEKESITLKPHMTQNLKTCATPRLLSPSSAQTPSSSIQRKQPTSSKNSKQLLNSSSNQMDNASMNGYTDDLLMPQCQTGKFEEKVDLSSLCGPNIASLLLPQLPNSDEMVMELEELDQLLETDSSGLKQPVNQYVTADLSGCIELPVFHGEIPSKKTLRVMNAPGQLNDFYTSTVDWSSMDLLAAALEVQLYIWNVASDEVTEFPLELQEVITSVKFSANGELLAVAFDTGDIHVYHVQTEALQLNMSICTGRIGCMVWTNGLQCAGTKQGFVTCVDVSLKKVIHSFDLCAGEICSLAANCFETSLAVGCNDNVACVIHWSDPSKITLLPHLAAVKGLAWNPAKDEELATGGGSGDRYQRIWSVEKRTQLRSVNTQSQVSSILWKQNELITAHGFTSYSLVKYNAQTLQPIERFTGHLARILSTCSNSTKTRICSAGADDTLRIWQVYEEPVKQTKTPKKQTVLTSPIKYTMR